jgi:hypothetical protein
MLSSKGLEVRTTDNATNLANWGVVYYQDVSVKNDSGANLLIQFCSGYKNNVAGGECVNLQSCVFRVDEKSPHSGESIIVPMCCSKACHEKNVSGDSSDPTCPKPCQNLYNWNERIICAQIIANGETFSITAQWALGENSGLAIEHYVEVATTSNAANHLSFVSCPDTRAFSNDYDYETHDSGDSDCEAQDFDESDMPQIYSEMEELTEMAETVRGMADAFACLLHDLRFITDSD